MPVYFVKLICGFINDIGAFDSALGGEFLVFTCLIMKYNLS